MGLPIYSILQLGVLGFLGGPIAGLYGLKKNFDALENRKASTATIILGFLIVSAFPLIIMYWPDSVSKIVITAVVTILTCVVAFIFQFKSWDREAYISQKAFNVVLVLIFSWVATFIYFFLIFFALELIGVDIGVKE